MSTGATWAKGSFTELPLPVRETRRNLLTFQGTWARLSFLSHLNPFLNILSLSLYLYPHTLIGDRCLCPGIFLSSPHFSLSLFKTVRKDCLYFKPCFFSCLGVDYFQRILWILQESLQLFNNATNTMNKNRHFSSLTLPNFSVLLKEGSLCVPHLTPFPLNLDQSLSVLEPPATGFSSPHPKYCPPFKAWTGWSAMSSGSLCCPSPHQSELTSPSPEFPCSWMCTFWVLCIIVVSITLESWMP